MPRCSKTRVPKCNYLNLLLKNLILFVNLIKTSDVEIPFFRNPNKFVKTFRNKLKSKCAILFPGNPASRFQSKFQNSSVKVYLGNNALRFQESSAQAYQDSNAMMFQGSNVQVFQNNRKSRNVIQSQDSSATPSRANNVQQFQGKNSSSKCLPFFL